MGHSFVSMFPPRFFFLYLIVLPVSSRSAMTCTEPRRGTNVHIKYRLPPMAFLANVHILSVGPRRGDRLYFSRCHGEGQGNSGGAAQRSEVTGLRVRSFPGVKALLELGARVADVEALLADCVVAMETDEHSTSGRVNSLPGLRTRRQTENHETYETVFRHLEVHITCSVH